MHLLLLGLFLFKYCVGALYFDTNKVIELGLNNVDKVTKSYFGYSLLLQKGTNPMVIVGAPKQSNLTGGSVYSCDILHGSKCVKYSISTVNAGTFNGNFLGLALDGDDNTGHPFVACAPRKVTVYGGTQNRNYFLKGSCFYQRNSSLPNLSAIELVPLKNEVPISSLDGQYYYDYAFGQAGIDVVYDGDTASVILGGTGIKNWNGGIVSQSLTRLSDHKIIPKKKVPEESESYDYLGYKIGKGTISETSFIFAGAPRAENLLGKVKLFNDYGLYRSFKGEELGSYFGSAVLTEDVNNDGSDDLFIGAPMTAGFTFDEGCVYYYKNAQGSSMKLVGKMTKGARFGASIVTLGDLNLDSYNDVAIAAPFEDDGIGAVYIYMGGSEGIKITFSQRLTPSLFPGNYQLVRGFGLGLSRGNDIDGNGHNDLAIGAYQSGNVFVITTKSVIDFRIDLESNLTSINTNDNQMNIKYCVYFKARSSTGFVNSVDFQMKFILDYRVKGSKVYIKNVTAFPEVPLCESIDIFLEKAIMDIEPFKFSLRTDVLGNLVSEGRHVTEKSIPVVHGCGDDNICQTQILVDVLTDTDTIILGLTKVIDAKISAENVGEPGYQCQLLIEAPKGLELREEKKCSFSNSTYICPFANKLGVEQEKGMLVTFDVDSINESVTTLEVSFEVKCLGENNYNKNTINIGVLVKNSPYIEGSSEPDSYEYSDENANKEIESTIHHSFILGNFGPSPVKTEIKIIMPMVKIGTEDVFKFIEAKGSLRGIQVPCYLSNDTEKYQSSTNVTSLVRASLSRTVILDCFSENSQCLELICEGDYLYKSSEIAKYVVKVKTRTDLLAKFFQSQPEAKNIAAYITSAFLFNGTLIEGHAVTLMLSSHSTKVPLWVYIVSAISGIILLGLLIFAFYKCHFFDRIYRDKMNDELLMDQQIEMNITDLSDTTPDEKEEEVR